MTLHTLGSCLVELNTLPHRPSAPNQTHSLLGELGWAEVWMEEHSFEGLNSTNSKMHFFLHILIALKLGRLTVALILICSTVSVFVDINNGT